MMSNNHMYGNMPNNFMRPGMSASAVPKVWSDSASPRFQPFMSPQTKIRRPYHMTQPGTHMYGYAQNRFIPTESFHRKEYEERFPEAFRTTDNGKADYSYDNHRNNYRLMQQREPIPLHMWIIKPVPGSQEICVEGKKSMREENFWHSDCITERLDEKTVMTATGSVYRLEGNMELMDAMAVGFSRSLVEAFWLGFPADWKTLIANHFQTITQTEGGLLVPPESNDLESDNEVSFVDAVDLEDTLTDDMDEKSTQSKRSKPSDNYDEVDGADIECRLSEEDDIIIREAAGDLYGEVEEASDKVVADTRTRQPTKKQLECKEHTLSKWIIKFLADGKGIYVVGEIENGSLWHSSAVEKRLSQRKILSCTGSVYNLIGSMDKFLALNEDLPMEIYNKFKRGFPKEWQEIAQQHVQGTQSNSEMKKPKMSAVKQKSVRREKKPPKPVNTPKETKISKLKKTEKKSRSNKNVSPSSVNQTKAGNKSTGSKNRNMYSKKPVGKECESTEEEEEEKYDARRYVITPRGQVVDLENLGRSRSGRLIKPPLHSWARQKVSLEGDRVVLQTTTAGASQFLKEFEDKFQNTSCKIQPYFNPMKKNVDYSILKNTRSKNNLTRSEEKRTNSDNDMSNRTKKSDVCSIQSEVSNSNIDSLSSEDTCSSDRKLVVAVTDIIQTNRARRSQKRSRRETCYNMEAKDKNNETCHSNEDAYNLNETSDSLDRTFVNGDVNMNGTDSEEGEIKPRNTRRRSKGTISGQTDTCTDEEYGTRRKTRKSERRSVAENETEVEGTREGIPRTTRRTRSTEDICKDSVKTRANYDCEIKDNSGNSGRKRISVELMDINESKMPVTTGSNHRSITSSSRPRRSCTKLAPIIIISDDGESCEEVSAKPTKKTENKMKRKRAEKNSTSRNNIKDSEDEWTNAEIEKLYRACKDVPVNQPKYWEKVADVVQTRSAVSCNKMFYHSEKSLESARRTKKDTKAKPKVTAVTAGVGTLKRKKQLQEILKQHSENYEDDLFDSTPFRKTRKRKVPPLNELGNSLFEELARKQGRAFETPKGPGNIAGPDVLFASPEKTPGTHLYSDVADESVDMDGYVHNMVKRRQQAKRKNRAKTSKITETPKPVKKKVSLSPSLNLFHEYLNESKCDKENDADSENEEDYYWDEENEEMTN